MKNSQFNHRALVRAPRFCRTVLSKTVGLFKFVRSLGVGLALLTFGLPMPKTDLHAQSAHDENSSLDDPAIPVVNPVVEWNKILLTIVRTPGAQPATVHATRSFALLHAAIYDAVNAIEQTHEPYLVPLDGVPQSASQDAAAVSAAHDVLVNLYPGFKDSLDAHLVQSLAEISTSEDQTEGLSVGQAVAQRILSLRKDDQSSAAPIPFVFMGTPGRYQSTPPNFPAQPTFTHWSHVTPFILERADQFRPGPPPALSSGHYAHDFNEIKLKGGAGGTLSSADEALTGRFWNGPIQNYWNEISQNAALAYRLGTAESARLFALLDLTIADCAIAFYDAKYTYVLWRPVTAIRASDSDDNRNTVADSNWLPLVGNTPPDPSYPGAHAVISAAAETVLIGFFQRDQIDLDVTSEVLPGVTRSFKRFSDVALEASLSRIFAGVHFRNDEVVGEELGRNVAEFTITHSLTLILEP